MRRNPRAHDHDPERLHLEALEQLPESERRLRRLAIWTADDEHSVDSLREQLAVDQPEQRRPVEDDVVVLRILDLLEEAVERIAREQLGGIGGPASTGEHVEASGARAGRAQLEDAARSAVQRSGEHLRETRRLIHIEELVQLGPAHVGGDEPRTVQRLGEHEPEGGRDLGLALTVQRARDEYRPPARARKATPQGRLQGLIRLVLSRAERLGAVPERPAHVGNLGEHGELEQAAQLPGTADPRLELGAREHDERGDEERRKQCEDAIPDRTRREGGSRRLGGLGERELRARSGGAHIEIREALPNRGALRLDLRPAPARKLSEGAAERRPSAVQPPVMAPALLREERGRDGVGDLGRALRSVVRRDDVDDVRPRIDGRGDLVLERRGTLAGDPPRRPEPRLPGREQRVDRGQAPLGGVHVSGLERIGGAFENDLGPRLVRLREHERREHHDGYEREYDHGDQQLAAAQRIQIPARLDRLVGRERRRGVPDQAVDAIDHYFVATVARPCRTLLAVFSALLALAAGCSSSSSTPPAPSAARTDSRPPTVEFVGPTRLAERATLRANARSDSSRVVAVTFTLDGRPLGSDTTKPYELDVDPAFLPSGRHRLVVGVVDALGRRATAAPKTVTVASVDSHVVKVAPGRSFSGVKDALRRGNVTVQLAPGRYQVRELELGSGARLVGSGSRTVIAPSGGGYWALLVAKGNGIRISDLAIDGGGGPAARSSRDGGIAVAVFDGSRDVRLQRLHIRRVRTHGVSVWGTHAGVSVQDSVIDGGGTAHAGVYSLGSDRSRDTSVIRSRIHGFRSYGILLGQKEFGRPKAALHGVALDNEISDIRDPERDACVRDARNAEGCGTNEGGIWTGGVEAAIIGNTIRRARWDGIETVGSSTRTTIVANEIRGTRTGIYLEHSTNYSLISRNVIVDARTGINVEWRHEGQGSSNNTFSFNRVVRAESGLFVDVGSDRNRIEGNVFVGGARPAITLQGSSENVVQRNLGCGGAVTSLVGFESARWDDGAPAHSRRNRLSANRSVPNCRT